MPEITASGFVNRNIIEYLTTDKRVKQYRCNTLQNPLAYYDGAQFRPVDIQRVTDSYTDKAKGIYLRDKSIVSVGIKKADDAYKFIGLRPDEKQDGSEQLEFSLEGIEVNGKSQTIDLSKKTAISSISHNLGPLVVQSARQRTRIMLPLTNADDGFKISLRLHLTGLTVTYRPDLDEYWIYNEKGEFRFRLGKPYLVDPETMNPLHGELGSPYPSLVKHSLTEISKGEYLYVKEPTEAFGKVQLPASFLIDADTVYSSTADGYIQKNGTSWADAHDATTGTNVYTTVHNGYGIRAEAAGTFYISRSFMYFDVSAEVGTVSAATVYIFGYSEGTGTIVSVQLGAQAATLTTADFDSFAGSSYGTCAGWNPAAYNGFSFNAQGVIDLQAVFGGTFLICLRENSADYANVSPPAAKYAPLWFSDEEGTDYDPYLSITMEAPPGSAVPAYYRAMLKRRSSWVY